MLATELYRKHLNADNRMTCYSSKCCAQVTLNEIINELQRIPGMEERVKELLKVKEEVHKIF